MGYKLARLIIRLIMWCVSRVKVYGIENLPEAGGYVVAANHLGRLDVPLIYYLLNRRDIILMVAEKYRESAIYRWFVRQLDAIYIDRFNADFTALRQILHRLKAGGALVLAPEGTRSPTGALQPARAGASYLASKAGAPIVPVAVIGSEDAKVAAGLRRLKRAHLVVRIGKPFRLPPLPVKDRDAALECYTDEIMCQIAALLPTEYRGVYAGHPKLKEILGQIETPV
jgi:1-acyl-sn-glycerol-3-phosphate acyltransferase